MDVFRNKTVLITGGTGSFGKKLTEVILQNHKPKKVIIYSRDEFKQYEMLKEFKKFKSNVVLRFFIGDVRDKERLMRAFVGVDFIVHAAALKQVPAMEYNPTEAIKTNIMGAMNVIEAALDRKVKKIIALSTDKACNPINLYGATKLCSDKLFVAANSYSGYKGAKFSVVRYGNVIGSRGSVIPAFLEKKHEGVLSITDPRMTRFWITLDECVRFVIKNFSRMKGGEVFVPKIPSMKITDMARTILPGCKFNIIGIRPGEKLHEVMISRDDGRNVIELKDCYIIEPSFNWWSDNRYYKGKQVAEGFEFSSNLNPLRLSNAKLISLLRRI